jgi:multimeric flavodoxin WrbA
MRVLGVLGSPRMGGNSDILLEEALKGARDGGAEMEKIVLCQKKVAGCLDCQKCNETGLCVIQDDMPEIHKKILEAEAVIHSVPVYFWAMTAQMKAYLDRWCAFFDEEWKWHKHYYPKLNRKKIGLITVCGDADVHTADPIVHSFRTTCQFTKLNFIGTVMASASGKGEIAGDERAMKEAYELGQKAVRS